jgi:hypothetical protein
VATTSVTTTTITQKPAIFSTFKPIVVMRPMQKPQRPCQHGQYYPYPNSCTSFLICVNGNLVSQQCGPGLNWNMEKNMCDWAFKNPCAEKPHKNALLVEMDNPSNVSDYNTCIDSHHKLRKKGPKNTKLLHWILRYKRMLIRMLLTWY